MHSCTDHAMTDGGVGVWERGKPVDSSRERTGGIVGGEETHQQYLDNKGTAITDLSLTALSFTSTHIHTLFLSLSIRLHSERPSFPFRETRTSSTEGHVTTPTLLKQDGKLFCQPGSHVFVWVHNTFEQWSPYCVPLCCHFSVTMCRMKKTDKTNMEREGPNCDLFTGPKMFSRCPCITVRSTPHQAVRHPLQSNPENGGGGRGFCPSPAVRVQHRAASYARPRTNFQPATPFGRRSSSALVYRTTSQHTLNLCRLLCGKLCGISANSHLRWH